MYSNSRFTRSKCLGAQYFVTKLLLEYILRLSTQNLCNFKIGYLQKTPVDTFHLYQILHKDSILQNSKAKYRKMAQSVIQVNEKTGTQNLLRKTPNYIGLSIYSMRHITLLVHSFCLPFYSIQKHYIKENRMHFEHRKKTLYGESSRWRIKYPV